jgi:hypothetical protein
VLNDEWIVQLSEKIRTKEAIISEMKLYVRHVEQTNKKLNETMKLRRSQVF